jgi:hypothetical protein
MIPQHAIAKQVTNRLDVFGEQVQEMFVIPFFDKNILTVHAAVVDVIIGVVEQG